MEGIQRDYRRIVIMYGIFIAACFPLAVFSSQWNRAVSYFSEIFVDDRTAELSTSIGYRYQNKFNKTLSSYTDFRNMYQEEISTAIPGLEYTSLGDSGSVQMVPQGVCFAGDYMLITAYDKEKSNNSVIYVLSDTDVGQRRFLTTLVLPDKNHVGGITFDGEYIWIAKSVTGYCSAISYDIIEQAVRFGENIHYISEYTENAYCGVTASFVYYYKERLWIGTHRSIGSGTLSCFRVVKRAAETYLKRESTVKIPSYAQGVSFVEMSGKDCMILSTSRGRYSDSNIYLYEMQMGENGIDLAKKGHCRFPPMAEEVVSDGEHTYFLFESAATCYSTRRYQKCAYPVDRVCAISNEKLLEEITY